MVYRNYDVAYTDAPEAIATATGSSVAGVFRLAVDDTATEEQIFAAIEKLKRALERMTLSG